MNESPNTLIGSQPTCEQKIAATQSHPAKLAHFSTAIDTKQADVDFGDEESNKIMKEQMKTVQLGLDRAADALEGATVETRGNHVEIKVAVMGGFVDGARSLVMGMFGVRTVRPVEAIKIDEVERPKTE